MDNVTPFTNNLMLREVKVLNQMLARLALLDEGLCLTVLPTTSLVKLKVDVTE